MIKSTLLILTGAGLLGTGAGPEAFQVSAGNVAYEITTDGLETVQKTSPEFGITIVTKGKRQLTIRF